MLNVLDVFSGIGGFSIGLEAASMQTVAFCEINPFCRKILKKHWPSVPIFTDITTIHREDLKALLKIDVIAGGFPCQDISVAGKGGGINAKRSGLWKEFARLINEIRPKYAIIENVANLRSKGLISVLQDLWAIGYDAEWHCIPASAVGAPHRRDRIWIVAHARCTRFYERWVSNDVSKETYIKNRVLRDGVQSGADKEDEILADTNSEYGRPEQTFLRSDGTRSWGELNWSGWWAVEPDVGRVAHGVPNRVDRLKGLGNAVVPQIPEMIGRAIK